jgi:hypothetical protein
LQHLCPFFSSRASGLPFCLSSCERSRRRKWEAMDLAISDYLYFW